MKNPRIYTPVSLVSGTTIKLDDNASKHVGKVLRMQAGDALRLFNGDGIDFQCRVASVSKKSLEVEIGEGQPAASESPLKSHLAIAMSRGDRMDYAIQKSVELGVTEITPLSSERCELKLSGDRAEKRLTHWRQVAVSACEQCGRAIVPTIHPIQHFDNFVSNAFTSDIGLVLHHRDTQRLDSIKPKPTSVTLLIGPEGGLSEREIALATEQGYQACTLGNRVFRTETAPVASLSVLQWLWGDFR